MDCKKFKIFNWVIFFLKPKLFFVFFEKQLCLFSFTLLFVFLIKDLCSIQVSIWFLIFHELFKTEHRFISSRKFKSSLIASVSSSLVSRIWIRSSSWTLISSRSSIFLTSLRWIRIRRWRSFLCLLDQMPLYIRAGGIRGWVKEFIVCGIHINFSIARGFGVLGFWGFGVLGFWIIWSCICLLHF